MPEKSNICKFDCFGPVTVLTDDLVVFQGDIQQDSDDLRKHDNPPPLLPQKVTLVGDVEVDVEPSFLTLALSCTPFLIVPTGATVHSVPLFDVYPSLGTVRINVPQIIAISSFNGICTVTGAASC